MKIVSSDLKKGIVKIRVNDNNDLWHLENLIEKGDFVTARTMRSVFIEREGRKIKVEKKPMKLKIEVEKVEYHKYANKLRVMGKIVEGPEEVSIGSYHTIEVEVGSVLTIKKQEWKKYQLERLKRAQLKVPTVLLVAADFEEATFAELKESGVDYVLEVKNPHSMKEEKQEEFYKKVASEIEKRSENVKGVVLAGPGFAKEHIFAIIKERNPELAGKIIQDSCSSASRAGINELLKRKSIQKIVTRSKILEESHLVEEFFYHLNKDDGLVTYGFEEVKNAIKMGAIKTLLVSEEKIRDEEVESLAREVERKGGKVEIISKMHDLGKQFSGMGGLGALLRFRINY
jgi:protein pelota